MSIRHASYDGCYRYVNRIDSAVTMLHLGISVSAVLFYALSLVNATSSPSISPSGIPSNIPTISFPTMNPTISIPTLSPTISPTVSVPTCSPTISPSSAPTSSGPTVSPTAKPTAAPTTAVPTISPSVTPTISPTIAPTTSIPSFSPTLTPTLSSPTAAPTVRPTASPTQSPTTSTPTASPTKSPTMSPTQSPTTGTPTVSPTKIPTMSPTQSPTISTPTVSPTKNPTISPTQSPTTSTPTSAPTPSDCFGRSIPDGGNLTGDCGVFGGANATWGSICYTACHPGRGISSTLAVTTVCGGPEWSPQPPTCNICLKGSASLGGTSMCVNCNPSSSSTGGSFAAAAESTVCANCTSCMSPEFAILRNCTGDHDRVCYRNTATRFVTSDFSDQSNLVQPFSYEVDLMVPDLSDVADATVLDIRLPLVSTDIAVFPNLLNGTWATALSLTVGANVNPLLSYIVTEAEPGVIRINFADFSRSNPAVSSVVANRVRLSLSLLSDIFAVPEYLLFSSVARYGSIVSESVNATLLVTAPRLQMSKGIDLIPPSVDAGDSIVRNLTVSHAIESSGPAFDIGITVNLDESLVLNSSLVTCYSCEVGWSFGWNHSSALLTINIPRLDLGNSVVVSWVSYIVDYVSPMTSIALDNDISMTYTSMAATSLSRYPATFTAEDDSDVFFDRDVPVPELNMSLLNSTIAETSSTQVSIHEHVTLALSIRFPEGVADSSFKIEIPTFEGTDAIENFSISIQSAGVGANLRNDTLPWPTQAEYDNGFFLVHFGLISNVADNVESEEDVLQFTLSFFIADIGSTGHGSTLDFSSWIVFGPEGTATNHQTLSLTVIVPSISFDVHFTSATQELEAGDNVSTVIRIGTINAPAYDVYINHTLEQGLQYVSGSSQCLIGCSYTWTVSENEGIIQLHIPVLRTDLELTVKWTTRMAPVEEVVSSASYTVTFYSQYDTSPIDLLSSFSGRLLSVQPQIFQLGTKVPVPTLMYLNSSLESTSDTEISPDELLQLEFTLSIPRGTSYVLVEFELSPSFDPVDVVHIGTGTGIAINPSGLVATPIDQILSTGNLNISKDYDSTSVIDGLWTLNTSLSYHSWAYEDLFVRANLYVNGGLSATRELYFDVVHPLVEIITANTYTGIDAGDNVTYTFSIRHTQASHFNAFDVSFVYELPSIIDVIFDTLSICVLDTAIGGSHTANDIVESCIGLGGTLILPNTSQYGTNGLFAAIIPQLEMNTAAYVAIQTTITQNAAPRVDVVARIDCEWHNAPEVPTTQYAASSSQTTVIINPHYLTYTLMESDDDSTSDNTVAIGEEFVLGVEFRIPEGISNYTLEFVVPSDIVAVNVTEIDFGSNIVQFNSTGVQLSRNPFTLYLGMLNNIADNLVTKSDAIYVNISFVVIDLGNTPQRGDIRAITSRVHSNGIAAASTSINLVIAAPLMTLDMIQVGGAGPNDVGADCGHTNSADPVSSLEVVTFRLQVRQRPQSVMNAYSVVARCIIPSVMTVVNNSLQFGDSIFATPDTYNVSGAMVELEWEIWPALTVGTVSFQLQVGPSIEIASQIRVQCGVEWVSVPDSSVHLGRTESEANPHFPWSNLMCELEIVEPILLTNFVMDNQPTQLGQEVHSPLPVTIHQPVGINVTIVLPEAMGGINLTVSTDLGLTMISNIGEVVHLGSQIDGSTYTVTDQFPVDRNEPIEFGVLDNAADFALNESDQLISFLVGAVNDSSLVTNESIYSFYIHLQANTFETSSRLFITVSEPQMALSVSSMVDGSNVVEAGDQIECILQVNVLSSNSVFDVVVSGTIQGSAAAFATIHSAPGSDTLNDTLVTWSFPEILGSATTQLVFVMEVIRDVPLGGETFICQSSVAFDGFPGSSQFGSGRAQLEESVSISILSSQLWLSNASESFFPASSSIGETSDDLHQVSIGERYDQIYMIYIPRGLVSSLSFNLEVADMLATVQLGAWDVSFPSSVICDSWNASLLNPITYQIQFGKCLNDGSDDVDGITVRLSNTTVLNAVQNSDGVSILHRAIILYENATAQIPEVVASEIMLVEPSLNVSIVSSHVDVATASVISIVATVRHGINSSSTAFDVELIMGLCPGLEVIATQSSMPQAFWHTENNTWSVYSLRLDLDVFTFTLTVQITDEALLADTLVSPDATLTYASVPSDHDLGRRLYVHKTPTPRFTVSDEFSAEWNLVSTSDPFSFANTVAIGESVLFLSNIQYAASADVVLDLNFTRFMQGSVLVVVDSISFAPGSNCTNTPTNSELNASTLDFGHCVTATPNGTSIEISFTMTFLDEVQNVHLATLSAGTTMGVVAGSFSSQMTTDSFEFTVIEPQLNASVSIPGPYLFLDETDVQFPVVVTLNPTFAHDMRVTVSLSRELVFNEISIEDTGSANLINMTIVRNTSTTLTINYGSVGNNSTISLIVNTVVPAGTAPMTELWAGVQVHAASSPTFNRARESSSLEYLSDIVAVWMFETSLDLIESNIAETLDNSLSIGEYFNISSKVCFRGNSSFDVHVTVPLTDQGQAAVSMLDEPAITFLGSNVDINFSPGGTSSFVGSNATAALITFDRFNNRNISPNLTLQDCFEITFMLEVNENSTAGTTGLVEVATEFVGYVRSNSARITVVEPSINLNVALIGAPMDSVEIGDNITIVASLESIESAYSGPGFVVETHIDMLKLDENFLTIFDESCNNTSFSIHGGIFTYSILIMNNGEICNFKLSAPASALLRPNEMSNHSVDFKYLSVPISGPSGNRKNYNDTASGGIEYTSNDLSALVTLNRNDLAAFTNDIFSAPIGAILTFVYTLIVPHVLLDGLQTNISLPPSLYILADPQITDGAGANVSAVQLSSFSYGSGSFLRNGSDSINYAFDIRVEDLPVNGRGTLFDLAFSSTYLFSSVNVSTQIVIVEPLLTVTIWMSASQGDAGDTIVIRQVIAHEPVLSGSSSHNLEVLLYVSENIAFLDSYSSTMMVASSPINSTCSVLDNSTLNCTLPHLGVDEDLVIEHVVSLASELSPNQLFNSSSEARYYSSPTGGRSYVVREDGPVGTTRSASIDAQILDRTGVYLEHNAPMLGNTVLTYGTIGEEIVLWFTTDIPEGLFGDSKLIVETDRQIAHVGCNLSTGEDLVLSDVSINCSTTTMRRADTIQSSVSISHLFNSFNNNQTTGDLIGFRVNFLIENDMENRISTQVPFRVSIFSEGILNSFQTFYVGIREPSVTSSVVSETISRFNTSINFWESGLDAIVTGKVLFLTNHSHRGSLYDAVAHDATLILSWNGSLTNFSLVVLNGMSVQVDSVDPVVTKFLFEELGVFALGDISSRIIQLTYNALENFPGDDLCITSKLTYFSMPNGTEDRRRYSSSSAACYIVPMPMTDSSSGSVIGDGEIAGSIVGVLLLSVLLVLFVFAKSRERKNESSAEDMLAKSSALLGKPSEPEPSKKIVKQDLKLSEQAKEAVKQRFKNLRAAKAQVNFNKAFAFARLRYGRQAAFDETKLVMVFELLKLEVKPAKAAVPELFQQINEFLASIIAAGDEDDILIDEVVDFINNIIPDLMLEACIDTYATIHTELEDFFEKVARDKKGGGDTAIEDEEGDYGTVLVDDGESFYQMPQAIDGDQYEIPSTLLNFDIAEEEPDYAEIDDDIAAMLQEGDYMLPSEFKDEDPDYEELLDLLEEVTYAQAATLLPEDPTFSSDEDDDEELTYNTHYGEDNSGDVYDNGTGVGTKKSRADSEDTYDNNDIKHRSAQLKNPRFTLWMEDGEGDAVYGLDGEGDTVYGLDGPRVDTYGLDTDNDDEPYTSIVADDSDYETYGNAQQLDLREPSEMVEESIYGLESFTDGTPQSTQQHKHRSITVRHHFKDLVEYVSDDEDDGLYANSTTLRRQTAPRISILLDPRTSKDSDSQVSKQSGEFRVKSPRISPIFIDSTSSFKSSPVQTKDKPENSASTSEIELNTEIGYSEYDDLENVSGKPNLRKASNGSISTTFQRLRKQLSDAAAENGDHKVDPYSVAEYDTLLKNQNDANEENKFRLPGDGAGEVIYVSDPGDNDRNGSMRRKPSRFLSKSFAGSRSASTYSTTYAKIKKGENWSSKQAPSLPFRAATVKSTLESRKASFNIGNPKFTLDIEEDNDLGDLE